MPSTTSLLLAAAALAVLLLGGGRFVRNASRVQVRESPLDILLTCYVAFGLGLASLATALATGEPLAPVLALAGLPVLIAPALLLVMHRRRIPLGGIRVREGDCLPAFTALGPDGRSFDSAQLRGQRVLLKFYRGHWCPFCSAELRQFEAMRPTLQARGIRVVALSKDSPEAAAYHARRDGLGFALLSDPELRVIRQLGLEHRKALEISGGTFHILGFPIGYRPRFESMAVPTTLLIDEHGRIRHIDQSDDYQVRADAARVQAAVDRAFGSGARSAGGELPPLPASPPGAELSPCP